jgi:hypothetical protein
MGGVRSLEVRWVLPGRLKADVAAWFSRFPAEIEAREDAYLLDPALAGLSVKIRAGRALEVKVFRGSPGVLEVPGRARGRMESWQKWSFPFSPPLGSGIGEPAWQPVRKTRRVSRFALAGGSGSAIAGARGLAPDPGCTVELTEVRTGEKDWWSLGFEVTGPAELRRSHLEATAALVFATDMPADMRLRPEHSQSYAEWLGRPPGPGTGSGSA